MNINLKSKLQQDNVFVNVERKSLSQLAGMNSIKGLDHVIISEDKIVNIVSDSYGLLTNEDYYLKIEESLIEADIKYDIRSINRDNRSFALDYILNDDSLAINVKNGLDKIKPMLRFTNSYDGSTKTSGHFGFFREVCSNGLHVSQTNIGFSVKHRGDIVEIILPQINTIVEKFMDNEYYSLQRKFEVLAETPIYDINLFVQKVCGKTALFQFESSEKNPDPSLNAKIVIETIKKESNLLGTNPNLWLGYNAFNEILHIKFKKGFENQKKLDNEIFAEIFQMAN